MQPTRDGRWAGALPRGRWFMPAWMASGAALDLAALYVLSRLASGLPLDSLTLGNGGPIVVTLAVVWIVHAGIMPGLAAGRMERGQISKFLALGVGMLVAGIVAALLAAFATGVVGMGIGMSQQPPSIPSTTFELSSFSVVPVTFLFAHAMAGASAGAVLHPFLAAALPRGVCVRFWRNVLGGLLAGAVGDVPDFLIFGYLGTPELARMGPLLLVAGWTLPVAALLPHLWFVGRAVMRSWTSAPAPQQI